MVITMPRKGERAEKFKREGGKMFKFCRGPLHRDGAWICVDDFYLNKSKSKQGKGIYRSHCKRCENFYHYGKMNWLVPREQIEFAVEELIRKLGTVETARRLGRTGTWMRLFKHGEIRRVQYRTAEVILRTLFEVRKTGEVRHRLSIKHGAAARGRAERKPSQPRDFYKVTGDLDLERRTNYRNNNLEKEREAERTRKARKKLSM